MENTNRHKLQEGVYVLLHKFSNEDFNKTIIKEVMASVAPLPNYKAKGRLGLN